MASKSKSNHKPLIALRGMVAFPDNSILLDVGRDLSVGALEQAMDGDKEVFLVTQKDYNCEMPGRDDL